MTSQRQADANRRNAQLSTGPRTEVGKEQSSKNAIVHGFTAKRHLFNPGEDPGKFEVLVASLSAQLQPVGAHEEYLVETLAVQLMRISRIPALENAIINHQTLQEAVANHPDQPRKDPFDDIANRLGVPSEGPDYKYLAALETWNALTEEDMEVMKEEKALLALGDALLRNDGVLDALGKLGQHEARKLDAMSKTLKLLRECQRLRQHSSEEQGSVIELQAREG